MIGVWPRSGDDPGSDEDPGYDDAATASGPVDEAPPRAPMPAVINLLVHAGTLLGWDTAPSQARLGPPEPPRDHGHRPRRLQPPPDALVP